MIIGWVAVFVGGVTLVFDAGSWFFLGSLLLSDVLRHRVHPSIPRSIERRRRWILLPLAIAVLVTYAVFDVSLSPTHPLRVVEFIAVAVVVAWLIRDDIRICRDHNP